MNERIEKLAEQCRSLYRDGNGGYIEQFDEQKFAELIVRECLKIVEPDRTSGDEWCVIHDETAQSIRQYFGIEQ